jgi:TRAP transporter TAXI family solute receptor
VKKFSMLLLAGVTVSVLAGTNLNAEDKSVLALGTATPGGGFPVYGAALAETVNQFDPSLEIQPRTTRGSMENVLMLEAGKLDIALVQGVVAHDVFSRSGASPGNLTIITAMYSTPGMFVVRADSPYHSIRDLIGKPVAFGVHDSGLVTLAHYVLDAIGLDQDRDFNAIYLNAAGDGPSMVNDGRAAALWGGGLSWPGFIAVAKSPSGARFIAPSPDEIKSILAKYAYLRPITVPAGSYAGQDFPISSVGSWSFVLARSTLSHDVAYRLARALHRGEKVLGARLAQACETTAVNTIAAAPRMDLIHPGVLKYFREIGLMR